MQDQDKPLSHPSQRRYPRELRERATRMVLEATASGEGYGTVSRVARQLGIEPETLRHWAAKAEVDEGLRPGVPTKERARIAELEATCPLHEARHCLWSLVGRVVRGDGASGLGRSVERYLSFSLDDG